jgi:alpha-glucosidase
VSGDAARPGRTGSADPGWPWWRDGVIYHVYLRSFADSNGDGVGDIPGLISRLDYLNGGPGSLGVDAIWLSPCFPSPDRDFGYDVADYTAIDPRFGTLADFDQLVAEALRRGMRVLLDLVYNHTSDAHPWFLESRSSRDNPRRDWYEWRDGRPGGRPPNNWKSVFGGRAWTWDPATHQHYHHLFAREQPDLNWRNPEVRSALRTATRFWLDRGVDGFRLDVFNAWYSHPDLPDNPVWPGLRPFGRRRFLHEIDQPEMHGALAELRSLLDAYPERAAVGEPMLSDPARTASYCGDRSLHMVFNLELARCRWNAAAFGSAIERALRVLPADGWPCWVLGNHDLKRQATRFGCRPDEKARVAAAMLLTLPGTPFLYYGEEIGLPDVRLRRDQILDPLGRTYWPFYKGRDPNRAPLPWNGGANGGFTTGTPWLPLRPDFAVRNVEAQRRDPRSVWCFYRDLLALRRATPALRRGSFESLTRLSRKGMAYLRAAGGAQALVALNFGPAPLRLGMHRALDPPGWKLALAAHPDRTIAMADDSMELGPFQAGVFLRKEPGQEVLT